MRLIPCKGSHPDKTVLAVSLLIMKQLKKKRIEKFDKLYELILNQNKYANSLFMPAINILFMLGLIEYHAKNDSMEYTGK